MPEPSATACQITAQFFMHSIYKGLTYQVGVNKSVRPLFNYMLYVIMYELYGIPRALHTCILISLC